MLVILSFTITIGSLDLFLWQITQASVESCYTGTIPILSRANMQDIAAINSALLARKCSWCFCLRCLFSGCHFAAINFNFSLCFSNHRKYTWSSVQRFGFSLTSICPLNPQLVEADHPSYGFWFFRRSVSIKREWLHSTVITCLFRMRDCCKIRDLKILPTGIK
ncbi:hypothetical protein XENOCAPTIV_019535 [Xenoophorus captivus]|uniref:Secreted protein n=1 Tax=Xenoophorus captivus TaxID=1517983 RepID=A0ABV0S7U7_9TELE